jgi:hypothetical protein
MITRPEERLISTQAYVPEHVPGYVRTTSGAEPCLLGDYLFPAVETGRAEPVKPRPRCGDRRRPI